MPFSITGVDFAGPMYVKTAENTKKKVYPTLFTGAATRAIHIEIVKNLTESLFMLASFPPIRKSNFSSKTSYMTMP